MARARSIKPGFYKNEQLAECSAWARLIFPGLWMLADRDGRLEDRPKRIKAELLPFDTQDIEPLLAELTERGFLIRYEADGARCIQVVKFKEHQSPHYSEKAGAIKPPPLPEIGQAMGLYSGGPPGNGQASRGGRNPLTPSSLTAFSLTPSSLTPDKEVAPLNGNKRRRFAPPSPEDVTTYAEAKGFTVDAQQFVDHYAAKGWKVGKTPMVDWQAAVRTWARRDREEATVGQSVPRKFSDEWIDQEHRAGRLKLNPGETYYQVRQRLGGGR